MKTNDLNQWFPTFFDAFLPLFLWNFSFLPCSSS